VGDKKEGWKSYPSDVSDEEWALCAPHLAWMREAAECGDCGQPHRAVDAHERSARWL